MRHRVAKRHFNRDTKARKALLSGLLRNLVEQGEVVTTTSKAKEIKRLMDRVVGQAKIDSIATRRTLHKIFGKRDVVNTLVDRIAPAMGDRVSGFTTISNEGIRRGDSADLTKIKFVVEIDRKGTLKSGIDHSKTKAKPAKKSVAKKTSKKATTKKVTEK